MRTSTPDFRSRTWRGTIHYKATTQWWANLFFIHADIGPFHSHEAADRFANHALVMQRHGNQLLIINERLGRSFRALDRNIEVRKLRVASLGKRVVNARDFDRMEVPIHRFGEFEDLRDSDFTYIGTKVTASLASNDPIMLHAGPEGTWR